MIPKYCIAFAMLALAFQSADARPEPAAPPTAIAPSDDHPAHDHGDHEDHGNESLEHKGHANEGHDHEGHAHEIVALSPAQISVSDIVIAPAGQATLYRRMAVPGTLTLDAARVARAPARVVGTVTELRKRLGDTVTKGEIVAMLDSREAADAKTEFLTASVAYDLKKTLFERAKVLWSKKVSAEQQYLQAEAAYLEADLRLDVARQKLSALDLNAAEVAAEAREDAAKKGPSRLRQYPVRSPISGRIIEQKVDVGTAVGSEGEPADLYTIADVSVLWIELAVPTNDLDAIKEGQKVEIAKAGVAKSREQGRIIFVSPMLNPETRSARVIAEMPNESGFWRPGTFVTADVLLEEQAVPVGVPRAAIQTIEGTPAVFVHMDEGFEKRNVKLGHQDAETVEILAGLSAGEPIAIKNTFLLKAELGKGEAEEHAH
jgi:cobalt-zinc-cadmium efflux system membrane fusion protein